MRKKLNQYASIPFWIKVVVCNENPVEEYLYLVENVFVFRPDAFAHLHNLGEIAEEVEQTLPQEKNLDYIEVKSFNSLSKLRKDEYIEKFRWNGVY